MKSAPIPRQPRRRALDDPAIPLPIRWYLMATRHVRDPRVLMRSAPTSTTSTLEPLTPDDEARMAGPLLDYMTDAEDALRGAGFAPPFRATNRRLANGRSCVSLLEHARGEALGFVLVSEYRHIGLTATAAFRTDFADGVQLWTSNSQMPRRMPRRPNTITVRLADEHDVGALYALHAFRVEERARTVPVRRLTRGDDPIAFQAAEGRETYDFLVKVGYYRPAGPDTIRYTRRGAVLVAWRGLFPWRQIIAGREAREAAAVRTRFAAASGARS
ncbi:MAG TPA: hypothetical protein VF041_05855 [Gemmatimonadaceae bacterium]